MTSFSPRELDVMAVLWELGSATVRQVQDRLEVDLAYTTVLTHLRMMEMKRHVRHEKEGRAYRFYPMIERQEAARAALSRLLSKIFAGSTEALLTQLVSDRDLTADDLRRMRRLVDELLEQRAGR